MPIASSTLPELDDASYQKTNDVYLYKLLLIHN
jgi:hypothetical protein